MNAALSQSLNKIQKLYYLGNVGVAIQQCQKVIKRYAKYPEPYLLLAKIQLSQGRTSVGLDVLEIACRKMPENTFIKLQYADACIQSGQYARASRVCRESVRQQPKNLAWNLRLAAVLQSSDKTIEEAIDLYQNILSIYPNEASVYYNLGTALKRQHKFEETVTAYRQAIAISPKDIQYRISLCNMLFEMTKFKEAIIESEQLLSIKKDIPDVLNILYYCHKKLSNFDASLEFAKRLCELDGESSNNLSALASAQIAVEQYTQAVETCNASLKINPKNRRILADKTIALSFAHEKFQAKKLFNLSALLNITKIEAPENYADIATFNQAIVAHVEQHPSIRFDGLNHTCLGGSTSNEVFVDPLGPVQQLREKIFIAVENYRKTLVVDPAHPWLSNLPEQKELNLSGWVTRLRAQGYQQGHIHPTAWISGVYYVNLPEVSESDPDSGGIEFGGAPSYYPNGDQGDIKLIRPEGGTLVLFPSYFYHRTIPFDSETERFTLAFDFRTKDFS